MNDLLAQPASVLVLFIATSALLLPGRTDLARRLWRAAAAVCGLLAAWGTLVGGVTYWPLLSAVVAILLSLRLIDQAHAPLFDRILVYALWAAGVIGFSFVNGDHLTPAIADAVAVVPPLIFPRLMQVAARSASPGSVPRSETMIGSLGTVSAWSGSSGIVRVRGELWLAKSAGNLHEAWKVLVTGTDGRSLLVQSTMVEYR